MLACEWLPVEGAESSTVPTILADTYYTIFMGSMGQTLLFNCAWRIIILDETYPTSEKPSI